ncbi:MAG: hypothetical protein D6812_16880 [Deltaproteobacteria bacterium]|nr:MAG: hypothetical protein D6812_16880 [Deltaproteobacteria bacterium]
MCTERDETKGLLGEGRSSSTLNRSKQAWLILFLLPILLKGREGETYGQAKTHEAPFLATMAFPAMGDLPKMESPPDSEEGNAESIWPPPRFVREGDVGGSLRRSKRPPHSRRSWLPEFSLSGGVTFGARQWQRRTLLPIGRAASSLPLTKGWKGRKKRFAIFLHLRWPFPARIDRDDPQTNARKAWTSNDLQLAALERIAKLRTEGTLTHTAGNGEKASRRQAWERIIAEESRTARIELLERIARFPPAATPPYGDTTEGRAEGTTPKRSNERP